MKPSAASTADKPSDPARLKVPPLSPAPNRPDRSGGEYRKKLKLTHKVATEEDLQWRKFEGMLETARSVWRSKFGAIES
jgi:hypothetical protein